MELSFRGDARADTGEKETAGGNGLDLRGDAWTEETTGDLKGEHGRGRIFVGVFSSLASGFSSSVGSCNSLLGVFLQASFPLSFNEPLGEVR